MIKTEALFLTFFCSCRDGFNIRHDRELSTFERSIDLASGDSLKALRMTNGTHEFPFRIPLAHKMPATFTGPYHKYHTYEVKVILERRFKNDIVVSKPVRIYHVPPFELDSLDTDQSIVRVLKDYESPKIKTKLRKNQIKSFEGQSEDEIQYRVSMPGQAIPFGSMFSVECCFSPLFKDWKLCSTSIAIRQKHSIRLDATAAESSMLHISTIHSSQNFNIVLEERQFPPEDQRQEWNFNELIRLPTSWDSYSQTVSSKVIKITHSLVVTAEFKSPDSQRSSKVSGWL